MPAITHDWSKAKSWPFEEARKLLAHVEKNAPPSQGANQTILFETGYGPSGLPHIGTFGEVLRTSMVRHAFGCLSDAKTRLLVFSDDMDGLRKIPDNIPNPEQLRPFLGRPLTQIPDPFGTHASFGEHNNALLKKFLNRFGFEFEFASATNLYQSGKFDAMILRVLAMHDEICALILPTLGAERRAKYSPFLPICPETGKVLQARIVETRPQTESLVYEHPKKGLVETKVTGGKCKMQWKIDWAMRWAALGVHYEMAGKDLTESVRLSRKICRKLGFPPPTGFIYELFLDENGEKISKSRGNGVSIDEWLRFGPPESLAHFMFRRPGSAKKLSLGIIPHEIDEYLAQHGRLCSEAAPFDNPVWHIHQGKPPDLPEMPNFSLLRNLAEACQTHEKTILKEFVRRQNPRMPDSSFLDQLLGFVSVWCRHFPMPASPPFAISAQLRGGVLELLDRLESLGEDASAETIQTEIWHAGKRARYQDSKEWFASLYGLLLGREQGPRLGSFIALYGLGRSCALLREKIGAGPIAKPSPMSPSP